MRHSEKLRPNRSLHSSWMGGSTPNRASMIGQAPIVESLEKRALLANPHFVVGPDIDDNGTTLTATGSIAGLGNEDVTVVLEAEGTATIICRNPAGKVAPGQTRDVSVSGSQTITDVKNGRVNFNVTTLAPTAPADACPNPKWTATVTNVDFTSATLTVFQGGQEVLQETTQL